MTQTLAPGAVAPSGGSAPGGGGGVPHARIAIVGSGFAGLGLAIRLRQSGVDDFVILERAREIGGTWRDNAYPGCACDIPSPLYSYSFAPNPDWSRMFAPQAEIQSYLRRCAQEYGVLPHVRFDSALESARWDEASGRWHIRTSRGAMTAQFLVTAQGALSEPAVPDIPGLNSFAGETFHTARWNPGVELRGRRVAVIGTGASAIQVVPRIQPEVARLVLFQRTAPWVMPRTNRAIPEWERRLYRRVPAAQRAVRTGIYWFLESTVLGFTGGALPVGERIARRHLRRQVADPELRAKLTPRFRMGCKRILFSNDYYPALTRPNASVVTEDIREITPRGIVTDDGVEHEVDVIVLATGFKVSDMPIALRICNAQGRSLEDVWQGSPQAYMGTTVAGFPNLFMMTGPNTGLGHSSMVFMMESQIPYILDALRQAWQRGADVVEVREAVQRDYNREVQQRLTKTVWNAGGCRSWYLDRNGRNSALWPGSTWRFRLRTRRFDAGSYVLRTRVAEPAGTSRAAAAS